MPERLEVAGPDGPVIIELTDAAQAEHGRARAIDSAVAALAIATPETDAAHGAEEDA